jgi:CubicO group peptidase (beta-lactamase class C family)
MLSKKIMFMLVAIPSILVSFLIYRICSGKLPRKPGNIPLGDYSQAIDYTEQEIRWIMKQHHLPSVAVTLIDDQDTILEGAFGTANFESDLPAESNTVYKVWSVAKVFTAIEIMRLVEDGQVDLDAPITEYLPDFSIQSRFPNSAPITIRSILTHRAGLPRNECHWIDFNEHALAGLIESLEDCRQAYPVNSRFKYSNIGFDLLGYLIQEMRGESFPDYMRKNLLQPIGMDNSAFLRAQIPAQLDFAPGYEYFKRTYYPYEQGDITSFPSGNLYSTIEDMGLFAKFIFREGEVNGEPIINPETLDEMFAEQFSSMRDPQPMGLGWKIANVLGSERMIWHDGGPGEGVGALVALLPERKLGVILIANSTSFEGRVSVPIAQDILEVLLKTKYGINKPQEKTWERAEQDPDLLASYVGKYAAFGDVFEVLPDGDRLNGSIQGMVFSLAPLNETTFQPEHWLADLGFANLLGVPIDLKKMKIKFLAGNEENQDLMIINFGDIFYEICPRYPQMGEFPLLWDDLTGEYDLVARLSSGEAGVDVLGKTRIHVKDDVLHMAGLVGPILPISETEIIILSGPFAGETMVYDPASGTITHQSIVYKKH